MERGEEKREKGKRERGRKMERLIDRYGERVSVCL